ncbi:MAG TPA: hypothetical protein VM890_16940 [Longimicrobium sp.]|jgi:glucose/arabinose dehydrogenase|nr:hypothetical protein [Longimicrobium sp.]
MTNRSFLVTALVALAACGRGEADDAAETQPAGTQPAPTAQHQAAPQTEPNTLQAVDAQPPMPAVARPKTYAECMATPGAASEAERERACMTLPDAPK